MKQADTAVFGTRKQYIAQYDGKLGKGKSCQIVKEKKEHDWECVKVRRQG